MPDSVEKKVRKVGAYPIAGTMELAGKKEPIEIVKLVSTGFMAHLRGTVFVGKNYQCVFALPGIEEPIQVLGKVVKTADQVGDPKQTLARLVEVHFLNVAAPVTTQIKKFLSSLGPKT